MRGPGDQAERRTSSGTTPSPTARWRPTALRPREVAIVLVAYVVARAAFLGLLLAVARSRGQASTGLLAVFDGAYYRSIATGWYPDALPVGPDGVQMSEIAFFPLLPVLLAPAAAVGVPVEVAALLLNGVAGAAAAVLVHALVLGYADRTTAVAAGALWSVLPSGFVLSLTYSEAVYSALAAAVLLLVLHERWYLAAAGTLAATLARPTGLVLVVVLAVAVVLAWRAGRAPARTVALVPLVGSAGFVGFLGYLGLRYDRYDVWFATQREGWGVYTDGGLETTRRTVGYLLDPTERPAATGVAVLVLAVLALLVLLVVDGRAPLPVVLFAVLTVALAFSTRNAFSSFPRFVFPATWVLLVPVLQLVVRRGGAAAGLLLGAAYVAGAAVMSALGVYVVLFSTFPP